MLDLVVKSMHRNSANSWIIRIFQILRTFFMPDYELRFKYLQILGHIFLSISTDQWIIMDWLENLHGKPWIFHDFPLKNIGFSCNISNQSNEHHQLPMKSAFSLWFSYGFLQNIPKFLQMFGHQLGRPGEKPPSERFFEETSDARHGLERRECSFYKDHHF